MRVIAQDGLLFIWQLTIQCLKVIHISFLYIGMLEEQDFSISIFFQNDKHIWQTELNWISRKKS